MRCENEEGRRGGEVAECKAAAVLDPNVTGYWQTPWLTGSRQKTCQYARGGMQRLETTNHKNAATGRATLCIINTMHIWELFSVIFVGYFGFLEFVLKKKVGNERISCSTVIMCEWRVNVTFAKTSFGAKIGWDEVQF